MSISSPAHLPAGSPASTGGRFTTGALRESGVALAPEVIDAERLNAATNQYLVTALWSSTDEAGEPLDGEFTIDDIAEDSAAAARADVQSFMIANVEPLERARALQPGYDDGQAAHDFWLTRNGHGAGFWDRGLGEVGDELTANAKPFGESNAMVGDDGQVWLS
jgi:hypothetical protein